MTKAELIAYLDAVCAAESAVDACVSSMKMLHNQINALHEPDKPEYIPQYDNFPVKEEVDREDFGPIHESELFDSRSITDARKDAIATGIGVGIATYVALCMILYVIARLSSPEPNYNIAVSSLVIGAIVFVITAIIQYPKEVRERKEEAIAAVKEADQRYEDRVKAVEEKHLADLQRFEQIRQQKDEEYNQRLHVYFEACKIVKETRNALGQQYTLQTQLHQQALEKREAIYKRGVIYSNCQNIVAVFTIREYLKMGLCSELEGTHGAYAQYMLDVRNNAIRNSIDELRTATVSALSQLQHSLCKELNTVRHHMNEITYELSKLHYAVIDAARISAEQSRRLEAALDNAQQQASAQLIQANASLARIQSNTDIIAINQYIANRMAGVDAYLA